MPKELLHASNSDDDIARKPNSGRRQCVVDRSYLLKIGDERGGIGITETVEEAIRHYRNEGTMIRSQAKPNGMVPVLIAIAGRDSPVTLREIASDKPPERHVRDHFTTEFLAVTSLAAVDTRDVFTAGDNGGIGFEMC